MKSSLIAIVMAWAMLCPAGKSDTTSMQDPRTVIAIIKDAALAGPVVGKIAVGSSGF